MPLIKTLNDMNMDSLRYLSQNTDISYLSQGGIARALVEATNLEINRLQSFINTNLSNAFLSSAVGIYLDLFGEMLGIPRLRDRHSAVTAEEKIIRFYVTSGTLGARLVSSSDPSTAIIPSNTIIQNSVGSTSYVVTETVVFPVNARQVYVSAIAQDSGEYFNVGANQLTVHNLSDQSIKVTNDVTISNGSNLEPDNEYRFRLAGAMTAKFGSNSTAIQLAAVAQPGVSQVEIIQFARGAGTFDVLLVPQGNRLSKAVLDATKRAVDKVVAFGISSKIKEPEYVPVKIAVQLLFKDGTTEGSKIVARDAAQRSILSYIASIPLGGELIVNQIRANILNSDKAIKDIQIVELCVDGHSRIIRNIKLKNDELFIPDENTESVQVI